MKLRERVGKPGHWSMLNEERKGKRSEIETKKERHWLMEIKKERINEKKRE